MLHTQKQRLICWIMFWFCLATTKSVGLLSKVDNDSKMNGMFGIQNNKMKNWETKKSGYTSEEKGVADQIKAFTESL